MKITGNFELFQCFNFETIFLKNAKPFQKMEYRFTAESVKIENAAFPYKTALSEDYAETNRIGSTKWTNHK